MYGSPCWAHPLQEREKYEQTGGNGCAISFERHTVDLSVKVEEFVVEGQLLRRRYSDAQLPISLAIQLVGADEASSCRVGRAQQDEVGRYPLVFL